MLAALLSLSSGVLLVILTLVLPNPHFHMHESTRCFLLGVVSCLTLLLLLYNGPGSIVIQAFAAVGSLPLAKDLAYEEKWQPPHQWARNPCRAWVCFLLACPWIATFSRYLALESTAVVNVLSVAASVALLHIFKTNLTQLGYARALELTIVAAGGIASLRECTPLRIPEASIVSLFLLCAAWFQSVQLPRWHANHQLRQCLLAASNHPSGIRRLRTSLDAHTAASEDSMQRARDVLESLEAIQALEERIAEPIRETDSKLLSSARERVERLSAHQLQLHHPRISPLLQHAQEKVRAMELLNEIERVTHLTDYLNLDNLRLNHLLDQARTNEWVALLEDVLDNAASVLAKHAEFLRLIQSLKGSILLPPGEVEVHNLQSVLEMLTRPPFNCSASQLSGGHEKLKESTSYQQTKADFEEALSRLDSDVDTWERLKQDAVLAGMSSATIDRISNCQRSCLQRNKLVEELKEVSRSPVALIDRSCLKELLKQAKESIWTVPPDLLQEAANSLQAAESCAQTVEQLHTLLQQNDVERLHVELSLNLRYVPDEEIALGQLAIQMGRLPKNMRPDELRKASNIVRRAQYDPAALNFIDSAPSNHTPRHKCTLARPPWESNSRAIAKSLLSRAESLLGREENFKRQMNEIKKVPDGDQNADKLEGLLKVASEVIGDQQIEIDKLNDLLTSVRRRDSLTLKIDQWMDLAKESWHTLSSDDMKNCLKDAEEHGVPNAKCDEARSLIVSVRLCEQANQQLKKLLATPPSQLVIHECQQLIEKAAEAKASPHDIKAAREFVERMKIRFAAAKKLREAMLNLNLSDLKKAHEEAKKAQVCEPQLEEARVKISMLQLLESESETYETLQNMLHVGMDPSSAIAKHRLHDALEQAEILCTQLQNQEMDHKKLMKSVEEGWKLHGRMQRRDDSEVELRHCTQCMEAYMCPERIKNALNVAIEFKANEQLIDDAREKLHKIELRISAQERISKADEELTSALRESRVKYTRLSKAIEEASAALNGASDGIDTKNIKELIFNGNSVLQRDKDTWQGRLEGFLQQELNKLSDLSNFEDSLDMAKQLDVDPELIWQGENFLWRRQALDRDTSILKETLNMKAASDEWIRSMNKALEEARKNSDLPKCLIDDCHSALEWAKEKKQKPTPPPPALASNWKLQLKRLSSGIADRIHGPVRKPPAWEYFLRELYTHFPHPSKKAEQIEKMLKTLDTVKPISNDMLELLKTFTKVPYHPDSNLKYGEDWHALSTEISKHANALHDHYKEKVELVTKSRPDDNSRS